MRNISKIFEEEQYKVVLANAETKEFKEEVVTVLKGVEGIESKFVIPSDFKVLAIDLLSTTKRKVTMTPKTFIENAENIIEVK